jgi:putative transposase
VGILGGSVQADHLHLVLSFPPKYSISEVVGFLKGKSTIKIFDINSELTKRYWGRYFWAKGYCVSTIGLDEEQVRKYVRWQLKKDKPWINSNCGKNNLDCFMVSIQTTPFRGGG